MLNVNSIFFISQRHFTNDMLTPGNITSEKSRNTKWSLNVSFLPFSQLNPQMTMSTTAITDLKKSLESISGSICTFSSDFISLYTEFDDSSQAEWCLNFKKLRDDTAIDAIAYFKKVLPLCNSMVDNIAIFFSDYKNYQFKPWLERVDRLMTKVMLYKENEKRLQESSDIVSQLKDKLNKLNLIESELHEHNRRVAEKAKQGDNSRSRYGLYRLFPGKQEKMEISESREISSNPKEGINEGRAFTVVNKKIIPSVTEFIEKISCVSTFFSKIEKELQQFLEISPVDGTDKIADTDTVRSNSDDHHEGSIGEVNTETPQLKSSPKENEDNVEKVESGKNNQSKSCLSPGMAKPVSNETKDEQSLPAPRDVFQRALEHHRMMSEAAVSIHEVCNKYHSAIPNSETDLAAIGKFIGSPV